MTATTIRVQMAQRKDTAANWTSANPILLSGELGYETDTKKFKIGNGSTNWNSLTYLPIPDGSGNLTITGNLEIGTTGSLTFEGSTADGFETTLAVTNPTADRTITLPNQSGTVLVSGNASIVNADVSASAAIAGTKISPDFGSQTVQTTGIFSHALGSAGAPTITFTGDTNTGIYSAGPDQLAISTGGSGRLFVDSAGYVTIGTTNNPAAAQLIVTKAGGAQGFEFLPGSATTTNTVLHYNRAGSEYLTSAVNALDHIWQTGGTERLRITSAGLVGVGTSSPGGQLTVYSAGNQVRVESPAASNADILFRENGVTNWTAGYVPVISAFRFSNGSSDVLTLTNTGRVGVGSASPTKTLEVVKPSSGGTVIQFTDNANAVGRLGTPSSGVVAFGGNTDQNIAFGGWAGDGNTFTNERARIDSSGRVGIGTSSPGYRLDVTSQLGCTHSGAIRHLVNIDSDGGKSYWYNGTPANTAYILGDTGGAYFAGSVGIGTTSPSAKLSVSLGGVAGTIAQLTDGIQQSLNIASDAGSGSAGVVSYDTANGASQAFKIGTAEKVRIDGSGRLLVGTSSARSAFFNGLGLAPSLQIEGTSGARMASIYSNNNDGGALILGRQGGSTPGGNALVANNDEIGLLTFQAGDGTDSVECARIQALIDGTPGANDMPGRLVFSTTADGASSPTERMRLTSTGYMLLGTTSDVIWNTTGTGVSISSVAIQASRSADACLLLNRTTSDGDIQVFARQGTLVGSISVTTTATAYNTSSDYRLKENVTTVTDGIARLQQLKPSRFNFIADPAKTVDGFLAHEAAEVVPECVTGTKDAVDADGNPVYQGIDQSKLVPLLTAALQEAIGEIESLKARLTAAGI